MNFKNLILGFAIIALMFNCSSSSSDDLSNQNPDPDPDPMVKVTYDADIKTIIDNNCIQCHGNPPNPGPTSYTTYTQVKNGVETGNILARINSASNPMPQSGLMSQSLRDKIQQWKDDGLLEN
jgi:mono/diheme cytochrome c family protein